MGSWNKNFEDMTIGELRKLHDTYLDIEAKVRQDEV